MNNDNNKFTSHFSLHTSQSPKPITHYSLHISHSSIWRITLDTNPEDCNLHCIMCEEHSEYSDFKERLYKKYGIRKRRMPYEWIRPLLEEAKELGVKEIIPTTMGDPLVSKHFDIIAEEAKRLGLKLNITHNGTFPRRPVKEWAKIIVPITTDIKFSVNGATKEMAESIMKGLNFERQIENIRKFVQYRNQYYKETGYYCRVSFQLTFMRHNMQQIEDIIKLAAELDVDRVKGHQLWVNFSQIAHLSFEQNRETKKEWNDIVDRAYAAVEKYRKPNGRKILLENFHKFDLDNEPDSPYVPEHYECPFLNRELWISATGKISPCCAPDELRDTLGDFGHYPQVSLREVLESPQYKYLVKNYKQFEVCKICKMRKPAG